MKHFFNFKIYIFGSCCVLVTFFNTKEQGGNNFNWSCYLDFWITTKWNHQDPNSDFSQPTFAISLLLWLAKVQIFPMYFCRSINNKVSIGFLSLPWRCCRFFSQRRNRRKIPQYQWKGRRSTPWSVCSRSTGRWRLFLWWSVWWQRNESSTERNTLQYIRQSGRNATTNDNPQHKDGNNTTVWWSLTRSTVELNKPQTRNQTCSKSDATKYCLR